MPSVAEVGRRVLRILVVDDHRDAADALAAVARLWGHESLCTYDAASAYALAVAQHPDAILADLAMPGLDGFELARMVRRLTDVPQPMLVAVTAHGSEDHRRRALAAGFDQFLVKPVDPARLRSILETAFPAD